MAVTPAYAAHRLATGPVECAPWCEDGDGHRDLRYREDQTCCGPVLRVPLSLHADYAEVYPVRPVDADVEIATPKAVVSRRGSRR